MRANEFITEGLKDPQDNPCWKGYKPVGTKKKAGKTVPNCVPAESVEEARAITKPEDGIAALKKFSAYLKKNIVNLASEAKFELDNFKRLYVDERFKGFLSKADGTPITPIFNEGGKLELIGPNKEYLNIPTVKYYYYRGFMYGGVLEKDLMKILGYNNSTADSVEEDWQKANKSDKTDGMSQKAVNAYRKENPGSKLKTAVTKDPGKLKKGSKDSKRRKSYCSRSKGQMDMHDISCAKTPDKAICKARRRWNCE